MNNPPMQGFDVKSALQWAKLELAGKDSASLDAQLLLAQVLSVERSTLLAHTEWELCEDAEEDFRSLVGRRARGEPLFYITGRREWFDREFRVTPATLIPRPETELLLEAALASVEGDGTGLNVVDIGTGSGALAICFATHRPGARVMASDISEEAVAVARQNGETQGATVEWASGDLWEPWLDRGPIMNRVLANLPYIETEELPNLQVEVHQYEPRVSLDGGSDGLELIRRFLREVSSVCAPGAQAWLEIGDGQGEAVRALVAEIIPAARARILCDYSAHDRILHLTLP